MLLDTDGYTVEVLDVEVIELYDLIPLENGEV
jgi:hypothetical protein